MAVFETPRLIVRELVDSDFDGFHKMQSDEEVMRYTSGEVFDEVENRRQLQMCIDSYQKIGNDFWVWAVERKLDKAFVGTVAIVPNEGRPEQELCDGLVTYAIEVQECPENWLPDAAKHVRKRVRTGIV